MIVYTGIREGSESVHEASTTGISICKFRFLLYIGRLYSWPFCSEVQVNHTVLMCMLY